MASRKEATITPINDSRECDAAACEHTELVAQVDPDDVDERRVLCPMHRVEWLRKVSER